MLISTPEELERLREEWLALWRRSPAATPFQSPMWLLPWWRAFGSDDLSTIVARNASGALTALLPLYIARDDADSLGMFLGTGNSDYLDYVGNGDAAPLLAELAELDCQLWDLQQLRPTSPLLTAPLPEGLRDQVLDFHREAARGLLDAGALRMHAIRLGERIVAVFYGFAHAGTVYYYLSGYDPELERLSIGTLIVAHAIEEAVREGATTFDFLRGAEEYKYAWGAADRVSVRRQIFRG